MEGRVYVESKEEAFRTAMEWPDQTGTVWTDGPRLDSRAVGAALAFKEGDRWIKRAVYLGKNKEVFDVEVFAILRAAKLLEKRGERGGAYTVFSDSQAAIARVQHDGTGPAQALAKAMVATVNTLVSRDNAFSLRWTPAHRGVEGNEAADEAARSAVEVEGREVRRGEGVELDYLREASLSHLTRITTERRSEATSESFVCNHLYLTCYMGV